MRLIKGTQYDVDKLECVGWRDASGRIESPPGYDAWAYFVDSGLFLGPDDEGIEPVFQRVCRCAECED